MRMLSRIALATAAVSIGAGASAQDMKELNFMSANHHSCAPYAQVLAVELGFWEDLGLKVTLLNSETSVPYMAFLQNGDADIAMLDSAQVLQSIDNDLPIKVIYEAWQFAGEGIFVAADSPIQSLADLRGKTIGLSSDRDLITTLIALDSIGETLESMNIASVVVGYSGPIMASSLQENTIQAIAGASSSRAGIEAAGIRVRNITPPAVSRNPGNSFAVWGPTMEEKREAISAFVKGWAMAQHTGVMDTNLAASACRVHVPEQFEDMQAGLKMMNANIYMAQIRRTKDFGELRPSVWTEIQGPYVKLGEITQEHDPATFLDHSFIEAANDWTTEDVRVKAEAWREANPEKLITDQIDPFQED